jgi:pyruvate formate lyase activating enzyme
MALAMGQKEYTEYTAISPEKLVQLAEAYKAQGNIGVAFTYNEPLIGYEFVRDTAKLISAKGMKSVLVTNGTATLHVLDEILPFIDAMNIDLKGFTDAYYQNILGGNRRMVMEFIERAAKDTHLELTTLIIPGENDSEDEMRELTAWVAQLTDKHGNKIGSEIPLHISRFFPRFKMTDREATDVGKVYRLAEIAREKLKVVYTGNC